MGASGLFIVPELTHHPFATCGVGALASFERCSDHSRAILHHANRAWLRNAVNSIVADGHFQPIRVSSEFNINLCGTTLPNRVPHRVLRDAIQMDRRARVGNLQKLRMEKGTFNAGRVGRIDRQLLKGSAETLRLSCDGIEPSGKPARVPQGGSDHGAELGRFGRINDSPISQLALHRLCQQPRSCKFLAQPIMQVSPHPPLLALAHVEDAAFYPVTRSRTSGHLTRLLFRVS